ncbi:hypothetical protein [Methanobrevibacter sp.]|uniref:hypothetical protein n=1 Tax=Methanobrevibacter sp. TaxID=66852 RepID=UPI00386AC61F
MKTTNIILIAIAILVVALVAVGLYSVYDGHNILNNTNITNPLDNNTTDVVDVDNMTNMTNITDKVVGDNSNRTELTINNATYKVYNPQSDSYVSVIGEKYDEEVNRWYTYDEDGVRYYNTRINTN